MTTKEVTTDAGKKVEILLLGEVPEEDRKRAIKAMDQSDDKVVVESLATGSEAGAYLYAYKPKQDENKVIVGLSLPGSRALFEKVHHKQPIPNVTEVVRSQHPNPEKPDSLIHYRAVKVLTPDGISSWGEVGQPEYTRTRSQSWFYNAHCVPQAFSKALRNAMRNAVTLKSSTEFLKKLIDEWVYQKDDGEVGKRKAPRSMGKVKVLNEESAKDPVVETDARAQARGHLFRLADQSGLDTKKNEKDRDAVIKYVEAYLGKDLSIASEDEMRKAGRHLDEMLGSPPNEATRAEFRRKVVGA